MRWRPGLGQWSSIEEPPEWRSVVVSEDGASPAAVAQEPRRRPSMFDAFRRAPEEGRREASPRPSMFRAFGPSAPEPERRSPAPRPERRDAPRPSMFAAFKPQEEAAGDIWGDMFGEPVRRPAAPERSPELVFQPSMSGTWLTQSHDSGKGFSWGLAGVVLGLGTLFVLEASGVTNIFGTRRSP